MKKKYENVLLVQKRHFIKTLLAMKFTLLFLFLTATQVFASVYSQTTRLSLDLQETTLTQVLAEIEGQSEFRFLYNDDLLRDKPYPMVQYDNKTIDEILMEVLDGTGSDYTVLENNLIVITPGVGDQQSNQVRGVVTGEDGSPLPGVTILLKGTNHGTVSNTDGNYLLDNIPEDAVLKFSFVGMKSQEIEVGNRAVINVTMQMDALGIEEVVAIGYGTQKKVTLTGAVSGAEGEDLVKSQTPNVLNSLTGHLPGVIINTRSGEPGKDDPTILIRGMSTTGSASPLILIDGVESNELSRINPNDIEDISVLKDATAAIYGARAANGVILVTTKRGKESAPTFNFTYNQGFSQPTRKPEMADAYTFAKVYNEIEIGEGRSPKYSDAELQKFKEGTDPNYQSTDWYATMIKPLTPQHQANLSVSGGNNVLNYYLSLGQLSQDGNFEYGTTNVNRYNFRSNVNVNVSKYFSIGFDLAGRYDDKHYPGNPDTRGVYSHIYLYQPTWTLFWPGTDYMRPNRDSESLINWVSDSGGYQDDKYKALESKLRVEYKIPWVDGLSVRASANYDAGYDFIKTFTKPTYVYYYNENTGEYTEGRTGQRSDLASLEESFNHSSRLTLNAQANYEQSFGSHNVSLMAGYEQMEYSFDYFMAGRSDFPSTVLPELFAGSSDKNKQENDGYSSKTSRLNYFGRFTYDYKQKYLAQIIMRYDGSPNFPPEKRWGFFPGISLGWRMSEEPFMQNFSFLDNLKIRGSYGEMGNDAVPAFQYLTSYEYGNNYVIGGSDVIGIVQSGVPNPNITWEVAKSTNFGFESILWEGALGIDLDIFKTERSNILTKRTVVIPDYTGLELPDENIGIVENKGFELQLSHRKSLNRLRYSVNGNFTFARNKVIFADEAPAAEEYQMATGHPIGTQLYYIAIGIFKDQAEIDSYPHLPGTRPGDIKYENRNNDEVLNSRDQVRLDETSTPEIIYGVNGTLEYGNFDCSILLQGQENAKTYLGGYFNVMSYSLGNFPQWRAEDRWTPENTDATQPRGSVDNWNNNTEQNTHWLIDAGFLRLKNLEIGYSLPSHVCSRVGMKNMRLYVSGNNLLILYDHMKDIGFDPETTDYWFYSQQRVFNVGVNLTF